MLAFTLAANKVQKKTRHVQQDCYTHSESRRQRLREDIGRSCARAWESGIQSRRCRIRAKHGGGSQRRLLAKMWVEDKIEAEG